MSKKLTLIEAARLLGCARARIYYAVATKQLAAEAVLVGGRGQFLVEEADLLAWDAAHPARPRGAA